jgi:hypothetical protein
MIETETTSSATEIGVSPGSSSGRAEAFPIEVAFQEEDSFTVELMVGEGPERAEYPGEVWWLDPLWGGRQPWLGEETIE